jgi:hypothetical protein
VECGSALLCRFAFFYFSSVFLESTAVLGTSKTTSSPSESAAASRCECRRNKQKQKRQSKTLPHSTDKTAKTKAAEAKPLPHSTAGQKAL